MVTNYCKTLKILNNLAEKLDLTLGTCVNLTNSFVAKFSKKFKKKIGCNFAQVFLEKTKLIPSPTHKYEPEMLHVRIYS
jgi:hypothetical protein